MTLRSSTESIQRDQKDFLYSTQGIMQQMEMLLVKVRTNADVRALTKDVRELKANFA